MNENRTRVTLGLPNIYYLAKQEEIDQFTSGFALDIDAKEFIEGAAAQNPLWNFEAKYMTTRVYYNETMEEARKRGVCSNFRVTCKGEELGEVYTSIRHSRVGGRTKTYCVRNHRIYKARERGDTYVTKDMQKALKAVAKEFVPRSIKELALDGFGTIHSRIYYANQGIETKTERYLREILNRGRNGITQRFEEFVNLFISEEQRALPDVAKALEVLPAYLTASTKMEQAMKTGWVVCVSEDKYACTRMGDDPKHCVVYDRSNLPEEIKCGIGMLKLVADKTVVAGVGYRADEANYFVSTEMVDTDSPHL